MKKLFSLSLLFIVLVFIGGILTYLYKEQVVKQDENKRQVLFKNNSGTVHVSPVNITIDYTKQIATGSPLIFGGAQFPSDNNETVWDSLQDVGATVMRTDFYIENMVPFNTSIDDYKANKNGVQNPQNWNQDFIQSRKDAYNNAKKRGMRTIGIVSYAPAWLTYSHTTRGVPMDWNVYEDIVKKAYAIHRDNLDYVEIWNEPTFSQVFLDVSGSNMTPTQAYEQIFYHAAKAIREVDQEKNDGKKVLIGGPVSDNPNDTSMLEAILKNSESRKYIDFISYHNYGYPEPSWEPTKAILKKYQMENLPIFITEWNYNAQEKEDSVYKTSYQAITYTAGKLIDFLKMGIKGANYYSFLEVKASDEAHTEYLGFYRIINGSPVLLPQSATWRLLSKDMSLGKGQSKIFIPQESIPDLNSAGFINASGQQGVTIVNASSFPKLITVHFKHVSKSTYSKLQVYSASSGNPATSPLYDGLVKEKNNQVDFSFYIPKESVEGIVLEKETEWYEYANIFSN